MRWSARALGLAAVLCALPSLARDVVSGDPPFRARVPDAFQPVGGTRDAVFVFVARGEEGNAPRVITLRPLGGPITQGEFDEGALRSMVRTVSPGAQVRVVPGNALGVDVPLVLGDTAGADTLALAQIPSMPRALQLVVSGPAGDGAAVERVARDVMASLDARTNWLSRGEILRRRLARMLVAAAWAMLGIYGAAWLAKFRRKPDARVQRIALLGIGITFALTAVLLATVRRGASAFEPVTPALVAIVLIANALQQRAGVRSDAVG